MRHDTQMVKRAVERFIARTRLTRTEQAAHLGIHVRELQAILYDEHKTVTSLLAERIAKGLGISVEDFPHYGSPDPVHCEVCGIKLNKYHMDTRCYLHEQPMTEYEVKTMVGQRGMFEREEAA